MSSLQVLTLVVHDILGLTAVILSYAQWMMLLKPTTNLPKLVRISWWASVLMVAAWVSSAYYYVSYYGASVKPIILKGRFAWAHTFFTETKEHLFLFLPVLTVVIALLVMAYGDRIVKENKLRTNVMVLSAIATTLGVLMTLFGVVISGAIRK